MATSPSFPETKLGSELKNVASNELSKISETVTVKPGNVREIHYGRKSSEDKQTTVNADTPPPGTYFLKANEARGKHMVQYVYASLTNANDETLPFHVRERYKELQRERHLRYLPLQTPRGKSPTVQQSTVNHNYVGYRMQRPASANHDRRPQNVFNDSEPEHCKYVTDVIKQDVSKSNKKTAMKNVQQTRSSNAVLSPKRNARSRSKTNTPRRRRPFSIAAESTSDTDPVENHRNIESVQQSPARQVSKRQVRREQYLATKFKHAAKNSKHTQTFVAAVASMAESSESATTVISRHHSGTQTEIINKNEELPLLVQPGCDAVRTAKSDMNYKDQNVSVETCAGAAQNVVESAAALSASKGTGQECVEWKRTKVGLSSPPKSPLLALSTNQNRVDSVDRLREPSRERPLSPSGRTASGNTERGSCANITRISVTEKRSVTSATQIGHQTVDTGIQVKLKKKHPPWKRRGVKQRRSPSKKSVISKMSSQSGDRSRYDRDKRSRKIKKKTKTKSRDPSVRSLRSLRSYQSDASSGILKHVKIDSSQTGSAFPRRGRSASPELPRRTEKKKKKKSSKLKNKKSSSRIARFLKTLSKDKEAINVINKMATVRKKGGN